MELSWANKARIGGVAVLGIVVIGIVAWPLVAPEDPLAPVRSNSLSFVGTLGLLALAFATGLVGYFIAWPHGREIAILAVPFGLITWVIRSGPMQTLTQANPTAAAREALLQSLRFEPVFWLLVVTAGFAGVILAQSIRPSSGTPLTIAAIKRLLRPNTAISGLAAMLIGTLLAHFSLRVFAQDLSTSSIAATAQPQLGQIIAGGIAAFAVAGFAIKKFFDLSYVWTAITSVFVIPFAYGYYGRASVIEKFAETQPASYFPHAVFAILPLQLVALGTIGAVTGYWLAVRYDYWRQHEAGA